MISILMGWGLGKTASKLIAYVGLPLLLILGALWALDAYGDGRYRAGEAAENAKWKKASADLYLKAQGAGTEATANATQRAEAFAERVEAEKEKLDEAEREGSSPFDVLFPTSGNGL